MPQLPRCLTPLLLAIGLIAPATLSGQSRKPDAASEAATSTKWGHSRHGKAYDEGPRQKPWRMRVGKTPFPISSKHPEVQGWFDQGNALLHGFWPFEAERAFRWCIKLDPDCAMAYLGLARAAKVWSKRGKSFLKEAVKRKHKVSKRERTFIEVFEAKAAIREAEDKDEARREFFVRFDRLLMDFPDDIEAQALYWLEAGLGGRGEGSRPRYAMEAVLDRVLAKHPNHVGALHYRIHNWDGKEGKYCIESCMKLPDLAPDCGHLLHMPGHVLSGIGLWHEAAIAMDRATRVEKAYMERRMVMPADNWDYLHNLDYLCYIQEQLGMPSVAILGAKQLLLAPPKAPRQAPKKSPKKKAGGPGGASGASAGGIDEAAFISALGTRAKARALVKFERWQDILDGKLLAWAPNHPMTKFAQGYTKCRALIGLGKIDEAKATLKTLKADKGPQLPPAALAQMKADPRAQKFLERQKKKNQAYVLELEARIALADGTTLDAIAKLTKAAALQEERWQNDPPEAPTYLYNALGEAYLDLGSARLAVSAFEKTLETVFHDGFALAGLVRAHAMLGQTDKAKRRMAQLEAVWADAEPNRWLEAARATGIKAKPELGGPIQERSYKREVLDRLGPSLYRPAAAPELAALDSSGKRVTLDAFEGKNIVLIFYLGDECLHCMEQIRAANDRVGEFAKLDTVFVAVSKDKPSEIATYEKSGEFKINLLSDPSFANAKRYLSYDDFEEIELHSTILIDKQRRVHWARNGGEPFMNFDFLRRELRRMKRGVVSRIQSQD